MIKNSGIISTICKSDYQQCPDGTIVPITSIDCKHKTCPIVLPTKTPTPTLNPTINWKTYENKEHGFSIKYPNTWTNVSGNASLSGSIDFYPGGVRPGLICNLYPEWARCSDPRIYIYIEDNMSFSSPSAIYKDLKIVYVDDVKGYYYTELFLGPNYVFPLNNNRGIMRIVLESYGEEAIKKINEEKSVSIIDADKITFEKMVQTLKFIQ
jgi:hypothetical protein